MKYRVTVGQRSYEVAVGEERQSLRVELDGQPHTLEVVPYLGSTHVRVQVDGAWHLVMIRREAEVLLVSVEEDQYRVRVVRTLPIPRRRSVQESTGLLVEVKAPMPGLIVAADVTPGARIERGRPVVIMEAMKMQMEIRAPTAGRVVAVNVRPGQEVAGGAILVSLDPSNPPDDRVVTS